MRWKGLITQVQLNYSKSKLYFLKKSWSLSPESALHLKTFGIFRSCGSIGGRRNHHSEILGTVDCISNIRIVHSCWSIRPTRKTMQAEKWLCMLTSMNISKSSLIPRIVPKCLVINAHLLMKTRRSLCPLCWTAKRIDTWFVSQPGCTRMFLQLCCKVSSDINEKIVEMLCFHNNNNNKDFILRG